MIWDNSFFVAAVPALLLFSLAIYWRAGPFVILIAVCAVSHECV